MNSTHISIKRQHVRVLKRLIVVLPLVVSVLGFASDGRQLHRDRNSLAELSRSAYLSSYYPTPPDGKNAATYFLKAAEVLHISPDNRNSTNLPWIGLATPVGPGQILPFGMQSDLLRLVQTNAQVFESIRQGAQFQQSRYPVVRADSRYDFSHLGKLDDMNKLLRASALYHCSIGKPEEALECIRLSLSLAASLELEPFPQSQLCRARMILDTVQFLEHVLAGTTAPSKALHTLQGDLDKLSQGYSSGRMFGRYLVVSYRVLNRSLLNSKPEEILEELPANVLSSQSFQIEKYSRAVDLAFGNEMLEDLFQMWKRGAPHDFGRILSLLQQRQRTARKDGQIMTAWVSDELGRLLVTELRCVALLRLAQVGIAAERYRTEHAGKLPEDLYNQLVPQYIAKLPQDVFSRRPIRHNNESFALRLFSVAPYEIADAKEKGEGEFASFEVIPKPAQSAAGKFK